MSSFFEGKFPFPAWETPELITEGFPEIDDILFVPSGEKTEGCPAFFPEEAFHFKRIVEKSSHLISSLTACFALLGNLKASSNEVSPAPFVDSLKN